MKGELVAAWCAWAPLCLAAGAAACELGSCLATW